MFHIVIAGICLVAVTTPISAQLQQNPPGLGFQPTNDLTVAKLPGVGGWGSPPPPPPGGWPPPPPPPPPTTAAPTPPPCLGAPVGECPETDPTPPADPAYLPSDTDCNCFYECSNGIAYPFRCPAPLIWNYFIDDCDWPESGVIKCYLDIANRGSKTISKKV